MEVACSNCGKPTTPKRIEKGINGPWTAYECQNGCKGPKGYPLSTKPQRQAQGAVGNGESAKHLASIALSLAEIATLLRLRNDPLEKATREPGF